MIVRGVRKNARIRVLGIPTTWSCQILCGEFNFGHLAALTVHKSKGGKGTPVPIFLKSLSVFD